MTPAGDASTSDLELPLSDIRVLEIGYGIAAPVCARTLAQFGADSIRVESVRRPDSLRTAGAAWVPLSVPWEVRRDTGIGINGFTCPEKRSVSLELDTPGGMAAFRRLVAHSDVLVMNMSVDAVAQLGLGDDALRELNPGLVHLNLYAFGSEGPYRSFRTWGGNLSALSGLTAQVGWPDRVPVGLPLSFPDYPSSMWGVAAIVAALLRRDATGIGCALELSQFQVAIECVAPTVAETVLTGAAPPRSGDRTRGRAADGVFGTVEADRHVVVTVDDDALDRLGALEGLDGVSVSDVAARLAGWTAARTAWDATWRLQEAGVAAFPVLEPLEVLRDEHLAARRFFQALPHARFGAELCYGQAVALSDTPARATRAAPAFGEHTREVLAEVAGMDENAIEALLEAGDAHEMTHRDVTLERPFYGWIGNLVRLPWPPASVDPAGILFARLEDTFGIELVSDLDLLAGTRVLDLAGEPLAYAGRVLVELGAEVVLVEPPGGAGLRAAPPLVPTPDGARVSATFLAHAAGKRSVVIDESTPDGQRLLEALIATADVALIPSDPADAARRGLDEARLRALNERIVVTSATAFGLTGPRRNWVGSANTAWAASGMMSLTGDADRPPVVAPVGLGYAVTSLNAAMGALLALRVARRSGRGQLVDVSMQEAVLSVSMEAGPQLALEGRAPGRVPRVRMSGVGVYGTDEANAVDINAFLPAQWDALAEWIAEELGVEEARLDVFRGGIVARMPFSDTIAAWIVELIGRYSKQEFFLEAQRRGIPCGAVLDALDLRDDVQLAATGAWRATPAPDAPAFTLPRGPLRADGRHSPSGAVPAPGQHDDEILGPLRGGS